MESDQLVLFTLNSPCGVTDYPIMWHVWETQWHSPGKSQIRNRTIDWNDDAVSYQQCNACLLYFINLTQLQFTAPGLWAHWGLGCPEPNSSFSVVDLDWDGLFCVPVGTVTGRKRISGFSRLWSISTQAIFRGGGLCTWICCRGIFPTNPGRSWSVLVYLFIQICKFLNYVVNGCIKECMFYWIFFILEFPNYKFYCAQ